MDREKLQSLYKSNGVVRHICDEMANRKHNQSETKLRRIMTRLTHSGWDGTRSQLISGFRAIEDCGCGQYVKGAHGWPSRFVWSVGSLAACKAAQGQAEEVEDLSEGDGEEDIDTESESVTHILRLRADFDAELQLPGDLNQSEVLRLISFIASLPIED